MWYEHIDWAVVLATVVGPIAAVIITLLYQKRLAEQDQRMRVFATMMRHRRDILNAEFVGALNLVLVYFPKHEGVKRRHRDLMTTFEDGAWKSSDQTVRRAIGDRTMINLSWLLSEISKVVGAPVEQLDIARGGYAPEGWANTADAQAKLQESVRKIVDGEAALSVVVHNPPTPPTA